MDYIFQDMDPKEEEGVDGDTEPEEDWKDDDDEGEEEGDGLDDVGGDM